MKMHSFAIEMNLLLFMSQNFRELNLLHQLTGKTEPTPNRMARKLIRTVKINNNQQSEYFEDFNLVEWAGKCIRRHSFGTFP